MGTDVPCEARSQSLSRCQWWEVGDAHELADSHVHIFGMLSVTEMSSGEEHRDWETSSGSVLTRGCHSLDLNRDNGNIKEVDSGSTEK